MALRDSLGAEVGIEKIGRWKLKEKLGKGGNGLVYRALDGSDQVALKILQKSDRIGRFRDEIEGMRRMANVKGVLPLIDSDVPEKPSKSNPAWFAMPIAEPLLDALGKNPHPEVITSLRDVALVLAEIHDKGYSHRDIKPDNLFKFNGLWSVGDFGLIEFEGKSHVTTVGEKIGPMHFIAPEMLLGLPNTDGKLADVFSLAKTLWVLLSSANFPIPGAYDASSGIYQLRSYVELEHSVSLDKLIQQCTAANPEDRPVMSDMAKELSAWIDSGSFNSNAANLKPYEPVGSEWSKVMEAAQSQGLARKTHNDLHAETTAALKRLFDNLKGFYIEIIDNLKSAGLEEVDGVQGTTPPGISVKFPLKSSHENSLEMEFRVWLNADWSDLTKRTVKGLGLCRMKIGSVGRVTELYRVEDSFIIDGPAAMNFIEKVKIEARNSLSDWLEKCAKEWEMLP